MVPWPISGILKYRLPDEHQPLRGRGCQIAFVFVLDKVHLEYPRTKLSSARYPTSLQSCGLVPKWSCVLPHTQVPYTGCIRARMQKVKTNNSPSEPWSINVCPSLRAWLAPCPANPDPDSTEGRAVWSGGEKGEQAIDKPSPHGAPACLRFRRRQAQGVRCVWLA